MKAFKSISKLKNIANDIHKVYAVKKDQTFWKMSLESIKAILEKQEWKKVLIKSNTLYCHVKLKGDLINLGIKKKGKFFSLESDEEGKADFNIKIPTPEEAYLYLKKHGEVPEANIEEMLEEAGIESEYQPAVMEFLDDNSIELEDSSDIDVSTGNYGYGQLFEVDGEEWAVMDDSDADDACKESLQDTIDDIGVTAFTIWQDHIDENAAESYFRSMYDEWNQSYCEDINSEAGSTYDTRLTDELVERDIVSDEDTEDENFDPLDHKDEMAEEMTQDQIDEGDGGFEHYKSNFGEDEANELLISQNLVDTDAMIDEAISVDGRGHTLSSYDGEEHEHGNMYFYRTN